MQVDIVKKLNIEKLRPEIKITKKFKPEPKNLNETVRNDFSTSQTHDEETSGKHFWLEKNRN